MLEPKIYEFEYAFLSVETGIKEGDRTLSGFRTNLMPMPFGFGDLCGFGSFNAIGCDADRLTEAEGANFGGLVVTGCMPAIRTLQGSGVDEATRQTLPSTPMVPGPCTHHAPRGNNELGAAVSGGAMGVVQSAQPKGVVMNDVGLAGADRIPHVGGRAEALRPVAMKVTDMQGSHIAIPAGTGLSGEKFDVVAGPSVRGTESQH